MVDKDADLVARLQRTLSPRPEILDAYLFGSKARGDASSHSDVDVAVYVDVARATDGAFGYAAELSSELMASLKVNDIDVVVLNRAPPLLYGRVIREGVRLLARDLQATTVREGRAMSRYFDYLPQLRKLDSAARKRLADGSFGR